MTDLVNVQYFGIRLDRRTHAYLFFGTITNTSDVPLSGPIQLSWEDVTPAGAVVLAPDGYTDGGSPYFDMTAYTDDGVLDPGETTADRPFALRSAGMFSFTSVVTAVRPVEPAAPLLAAENTKFYVVDAAFKYTAGGTENDAFALDALARIPGGHEQRRR